MSRVAVFAKLLSSSSSPAINDEPVSGASAAKVDMKFELIVIPVAEVDRSKVFHKAWVEARCRFPIRQCCAICASGASLPNWPSKEFLKTEVSRQKAGRVPG
jgi:hypothetical protein